jgi:hypothetical protein
MEGTWVHILVCLNILKYAKKIMVNIYLIVIIMKNSCLLQLIHLVVI